MSAVGPLAWMYSLPTGGSGHGSTIGSAGSLRDPVLSLVVTSSAGLLERVLAGEATKLVVVG